MLETVGDAVVKRTVLNAGRTENGVTGDSISNAFAGINVAVTKHIREASDLWMEPAK